MTDRKLDRSLKIGLKVKRRCDYINWGTGLTGRDVTVEAHRDVYEKEIDAFSMFFDR